MVKCQGQEQIEEIHCGCVLKRGIGDSIRRNFLVLNEFFQSLGRKNNISTVNGVKALCDGTFTANLYCDLRPELAKWKDSLLMKCVACDKLVEVCPCQTFVNLRCTRSHGVYPKECPSCQDLLYGTHILRISFADAVGETITVQFNEASANIFYDTFTIESIVTSYSKYSDFLHTLHWHVNQLNSGNPFLQNIVIKKISSLSSSTFLFVSGVLQPVADGSR